MKPAAAYIRVSTTPQEVAQQRHEIVVGAKSRGFEITEWYEEKVTGRSLRRPELDRLREATKNRSVSVLFIWALDRLSRAGILDSLSLVKEFDARGVHVISLKDPIPDPGEPTRELVLSVLFWVAEQESRRKSERVKAALGLLKERGVRLGRPKREVDLDRVAELREAGRSWRSIAKGLKVPKSVILRAWATRGTGGSGPKRGSRNVLPFPQKKHPPDP